MPHISYSKLQVHDDSRRSFTKQRSPLEGELTASPTEAATQSRRNFETVRLAQLFSNIHPPSAPTRPSTLIGSTTTIVRPTFIIHPLTQYSPAIFRPSQSFPTPFLVIPLVDIFTTSNISANPCRIAPRFWGQASAD